MRNIFLRELRDREEVQRLKHFRMVQYAERGLNDNLREDLVALGGLAAVW